ncbi:MAG: ribonuclease III [Bacillota bacterium]|nr:ribonuclease III [Bacillota bacterium]
MSRPGQQRGSRRALRLAQLEAGLSYQFRSRALLDTALTHRSWVFEQAERGTDNQRLEFLGDAVLGLAAANALYEFEPPLPEGRLSQLRAAVVCEATLVQLAETLSLGALLRLGHGEERTGGRQKASNLADAVEALLGAIARDSDVQTAVGIARRLLEPAITAAVGGQLVYDYKSRLLEWRQADPTRAPLTFDLISETGPAHKPSFTVAIHQNGQEMARGEGTTIRQAQQVAASRMLAELGLGDPL